VSAGLARTFASLRVPNYRRYFGGQVVSITGNWMQTVAEMWLMVELTGSGVSVGLTAAFQFLPILLFGAWGGLLADRMSKRRLLMITQSLMALPALALWALTTSGSVEVWMVYALVLARGAVNAIDNPARQSFAIEMVGADRVVNAVALNSVIIHTARILGPAAAGLVIALLGVGPCFLINALSFAAMLVALRAMNPAELRTLPIAARARVGPRLLVGAAAAFGIAELLVAAAPTIPLQLAALIPLGAVSVTFAAGVNSSLQLAVEPSMRGRVMALYSVVFLGSTPIGAPLVGWITEIAGPRAGLALGGVAALLAAAGGAVAYAKLRPAPAKRPCGSSSRTRTTPLRQRLGTRP
jgi:MFS family permease